MIKSKKMDVRAVENQMVETMMSMLKTIYSNKSSDEYKSHGDITLSSEYKTIESMVSDLTVLKKFPKTEASDIKNLFSTLHRPVFNQMVTAYIAEPNERNTIFTAVYTVGFRVLVGELSRIYSSTRATDDGIVYNPDKISKRNDMNKFIRSFNASLEARIDEHIRSIQKLRDAESGDDGTASAITEAFGAEQVLQAVLSNAGKVCKLFGRIFGATYELNPVAFINAMLTRSYDKKVQNFEHVARMYEVTKEAYDEYMKIPEAQRVKKIESRYVKNIEKYNIKMQNLKAAIAHYDQRAAVEAKEAADNTPKSDASNTNTASDTSTSNTDDDNNTSTGDYDF